MIEDTILANLIGNEEYLRKVVAHLDEDYFTDTKHKTVYKIIDTFIKKYNRPPTPEAIKVELSTVSGLTENSFYETVEYVHELKADPKTDISWLIDSTEKFCQDKAIYNALLKSVSIADGQDKDISRGSIPKMLQDALAVSFDTSIGHDFFDDVKSRYDFYHKKENKIPFGLHYMNEITKGGISSKTLTIILAGCVHPDTKIKIKLSKKVLFVK